MYPLDDLNPKTIVVDKGYGTKYKLSADSCLMVEILRRNFELGTRKKVLVTRLLRMNIGDHVSRAR